MTDVWLPKVLDAEPSSPTYNQQVRPHWRYEYDARGNQTAQIDPRGNVTTFKYDEFGRRISRTLPAVNYSTVSEAVSYDEHGRVLIRSDFKGQSTRFVYYTTGVHKGMLQAEYRYATRAAAEADTSLAAFVEKSTYEYDELGRRPWGVSTDPAGTAQIGSSAVRAGLPVVV